MLEESSIVNSMEIIKKPVLSSNQVLIWDCLRSVKINSHINNYGKLFKEL